MLDVLKKNIIFKDLNSEKIKELLDNISFEKKIYKKDISIAFRGDKVETLNIIIRGSVITEMLTKDGNVKKIETLKEGDVLAAAFIFGEHNCFPVDLIANEDTELLVINKKNFLKLLSLEKKILENFLNEISNKIQLLSNKIWDSVNNKTISDKFISYVRKNQINGEIYIKNLKELAESFGIARPSLSRVLGQYANEEKLERISRNRYKILDKEYFDIS